MSVHCASSSSPVYRVTLDETRAKIAPSCKVDTLVMKMEHADVVHQTPVIQELLASAHEDRIDSKFVIKNLGTSTLFLHLPAESCVEEKFWKSRLG